MKYKILHIPTGTYIYNNIIPSTNPQTPHQLSVRWYSEYELVHRKDILGDVYWYLEVFDTPTCLTTMLSNIAYEKTQRYFQFSDALEKYTPSEEEYALVEVPDTCESHLPV